MPKMNAQKSVLLIATLFLLQVAVDAGEADVEVTTNGGGTTVKGDVTWDVGDATVGASGSVDTSGGWSAGVSVGWRFKRRRRSAEAAICKSCINVDEIRSPKKLAMYQKNKAIDFAMTAKFHKLSYNSTMTELDFKVVEVLEEVPINFDFKHAKVLNIFASHGACAMTCLKGIVPGEYLITGKMFQGQLIINGKFLLLRLPQNKKNILF